MSVRKPSTGVGLKRLDEFCACQLVAADGVGPDLAVAGFADIERLAIRAEIDAVGGAHRARRRHDLSLHRSVGSFRNTPDVTFPALPVRIARIDRAVAGDRDVVGLVHLVGMKPDRGVG
ncbi:hypothetical protein ACVW0I_001882 [Bradyrhizobium sp. LM6.11]